MADKNYRLIQADIVLNVRDIDKVSNSLSKLSQIAGITADIKKSVAGAATPIQDLTDSLNTLATSASFEGAVNNVRQLSDFSKEIKNNITTASLNRLKALSEIDFKFQVDSSSIAKELSKALKTIEIQVGDFSQKTSKAYNAITNEKLISGNASVKSIKDLIDEAIKLDAKLGVTDETIATFMKNAGTRTEQLVPFINSLNKAILRVAASSDKLGKVDIKGVDTNVSDQFKPEKFGYKEVPDDLLNEEQKKYVKLIRELQSYTNLSEKEYKQNADRIKAIQTELLNKIFDIQKESTKVVETENQKKEISFEELNKELLQLASSGDVEGYYKGILKAFKDFIGDKDITSVRQFGKEWSSFAKHIQNVDDDTKTLSTSIKELLGIMVALGKRSDILQREYKGTTLFDAEFGKNPQAIDKKLLDANEAAFLEMLRTTEEYSKKTPQVINKGNDLVLLAFKQLFDELIWNSIIPDGYDAILNETIEFVKRSRPLFQKYRIEFEDTFTKAYDRKVFNILMKDIEALYSQLGLLALQKKQLNASVGGKALGGEGYSFTSLRDSEDDFRLLKHSIDDLYGRIEQTTLKIEDLISSMKGRIQNFKSLQPLVDEAERVYDVLVGHSIIPDLVDSIDEELNKIPNNAKGPISELIDEFNGLKEHLEKNNYEMLPRRFGRSRRAAKQIEEQLQQIKDQVDKFNKENDKEIASEKIFQRAISPIKALLNDAKRLPNALSLLSIDMINMLSDLDKNVYSILTKLFTAPLSDLKQILVSDIQSLGVSIKSYLVSLKTQTLNVLAASSIKSATLFYDLGIKVEKLKTITRLAGAELKTFFRENYVDAFYEFKDILVDTGASIKNKLVNSFIDLKRYSFPILSRIPKDLKFVESAIKSIIHSNNNLKKAFVNTSTTLIVGYKYYSDYLKTTFIPRLKTIAPNLTNISSKAKNIFSNATASSRQFNFSLQNVKNTLNSTGSIIKKVYNYRLFKREAVIDPQQQLLELNDILADTQFKMDGLKKKGSLALKTLAANMATVNAAAKKGADTVTLYGTELSTVDAAKRLNKEVNEQFNQVENGIKDTFNKIEKDSSLFNRNWKQRVKDFRVGVDLMFQDGGDTAYGLQRALYGLNPPINLLTKSLNKGHKELGKAVIKNDELSKATFELIKQSNKYINTLHSQNESLKDYGKIYNVSSDIMRSFDSQVGRILSSQKALDKEFRKTGRISKDTYTRMQIEIEDSKEKMLDLVRSTEGLAPEFIEQVNRVVSGTGIMNNLFKEMTIRRRQLADETKDLTDAEAQQLNQARKATGIWTKLFKMFGFGKGEVKALDGSMESIEATINETNESVRKSTSIFSNLFNISLGVFGGNMLTKLFESVTGALAGLVNKSKEVSSAIYNMSKDIGASAKKMQATLSGITIDELQYELPSGGQVYKNFEADAEDFKNIIKRVYGNAFGESISEVGQNSAEIIRQAARNNMTAGFTEDDYVNLIENTYRITDAFGDDTFEVINAASQLVSEMGLGWEEAFDFIAKGYKNGLNSSRDFLDTIREYSVQFAYGGSTAEEMFAILDKGLRGGIVGSDKIADTYKEFIDRIRDGSKTTKKALEDLGYSTDMIFTLLSQGQLTGSNAFIMMARAISELDDKNLQDQIGTALFGEQFKDLGRDAIYEIGQSFGEDSEIIEFKGEVKSLDEQYNTLGVTLEGIRRKFITAFEQSNLLSALNNSLVRILPYMDIWANGFMSVSNAIGRVIEVFTSAVDIVLFGEGEISGALDRIVASITSLFIGEFNLAGQYLSEAVIGALNNISNTMINFTADGSAYGFNYIVQIADGIYEGAGTVLVDAMNQVGEIIAAFTQPHSPPKEGPLNTIDQWGADLMDVFTGSFDKVNTRKVTAGLDKIRNSFTDLSDDEKARAESAYQSIVDSYNATGEIDQIKRAELSSVIGEDRTISLLSDIQTPKSNVSSQLNKVATTANKAIQSSKSAASSIGESLEKAFKGHSELSEEVYKQRLQELEDQKNAGIINEDEYFRARIKLETEWYNSELNTEKDITAATVREYKARYEEYKKLKGIETSTNDEIDSPEYIGLEIPNINSFALPTGKEIGETLGKGLNEGLTSTLTTTTNDLVERLKSGIKTKISESTTSIWDSLKGMFTGVFSRLQDWFKSLSPEYIFPVSTIIGFFTHEITYKLINSINRLPAVIYKAFKAFGGFIGILKTITKYIFKFSVAGILVYDFFLNFETYRDLFYAIKDAAVDTFSTLYNNIKIFLDTLSTISSDGEGPIENLLQAFSYLGLALTRIIGLFKVIIKSSIKFFIIEIVFGLFDLINSFIEAAGGAEKLAIEFDKAFGTITYRIKWTAAYFSNIFIGLFNGDFPTVLKYSKKALENFLGIFTDENGMGDFILYISSVLRNMIPQSVVDAFYKLGDSFVYIYQNSEAVRELVGLFGDMWNAVKTLWPEILALTTYWYALLPALAAISPYIGTVTAFAGIALGPLIASVGLVSAAFFSLGDILTYIDPFIAGIIRSFRGLFQVLTGIGESVHAIFTLDWEGFIGGLGNSAQGLYTIIDGLGTTILSFAGAVVSLVFSMAEKVLLAVDWLSEQVFGYDLIDNEKLSSLVDNLLVIINYLVDEAISIFNGLTSNFGIIINYAFTDISSTLDAVWSGILDGVTNFAKGIIQNIVDGLLSPESQGKLKGGLEWLASWFPHSPADQGPLSKELGWDSYLTSGLDTVDFDTRLNTMMPGVRSSFEMFGQTTASGMQTGVDSAMAALNINPSKALNNQDILGYAFEVANQSGQFSSFFSQFEGDANAALQAVQSGIVQLPQALAENLQSSTGKLTELMNEQGLQAQGNAAVLNTILSGNAQQLESTYGTALTNTEGKVNTLQTVLTGLINDTKPQVLSVPESISSQFGSSVQNITQPVGTMKQEIEDLNNSGILSTITQAFSTFSGESVTSIEDVKTSVATFTEDTLLAISQLVEDMKAKFEDADWESIGENIVLGIKQGIDDNREKVETALRGIVEKLVNETHQNLGIQSPSTVFASIGTNVMLGLASGIENNTSVVTNAMGAVRESMTNILGAPVSTQFDISSVNDAIDKISEIGNKDFLTYTAEQSFDKLENYFNKDWVISKLGGHWANLFEPKFDDNAPNMIKMYEEMAATGQLDGRDFDEIMKELWVKTIGATSKNYDDALKKGDSFWWNANYDPRLYRKFMEAYIKEREDLMVEFGGEYVDSAQALLDSQKEITEQFKEKVTQAKEKADVALEYVSGILGRQYLGEDIYNIDANDFTGSTRNAILAAQNAMGELISTRQEYDQYLTASSAFDDLNNNFAGIIQQFRDFQSSVEASNTVVDNRTLFEVMQNINGTLQGLFDNIPQYASGSWSTPGGLSFLHPNEMVLDADRANAIRNLLTTKQNYAKINRNSTTPSGNMVNLQFHTVINDKMDAAVFERRVVDVVSRNL